MFFDKDHGGSISAEEIVNALKDNENMDQDVAQMMMEEISPNLTEISFFDFEVMMKRL